MKLKWMKSLAVGGVMVCLSLLFSSVAFAQYQVSHSGVLDANNRIGSGGFNDNVYKLPVATGNDIVNGDVTGGFGFRGPIPYRDQFAFRGVLPGEGIDRFVASSGGVPGAGSVNLLTPQPFFGQSRGVAPPPGFVSVGSVGGYVPDPNAGQVQPEDLRLGITASASQPMIVLPLPGELELPGPVNPSTDQTLITASPLYGVRQWNMSQGTDQYQYFLSSAAGSNPNAPGGNQRFNTDAILQMRRELNQSIVNPSQPNDSGQTGQQTQSGQQAQPGQPNQPGQLGASAQPLNDAIPTPLLSGATPVSSGSQSPAAGDVSTNQSLRQNLPPLLLPTPTQQSGQYAELRRRLDEYNQAHPATDEEANRNFLEAVKARRALLAANNGQASDLTNRLPGSTPPVPEFGQPGADQGANSPLQPGDNANTPLPPTPMHVNSLATSVKAQGLAGLLNKAEDQMRHQKFADAIDLYDTAQQVAPNNPMILIGRANAELGGSFYTRCETDLREAFKADRALLLAQYDLKGLIGEQRLQYVVNELKQIASESPQNPTPAFLLAYVCYNTGNEVKAAGYLDAAQKRNGGRDDLITTMRQFWTLSPNPVPTTQP